MDRVKKSVLLKMYAHLFSSYGSQQWWPARTRFEVIVGAILVQNTNWLNVEKALENLKKEQILTVAGINQTSQKNLAGFIRPAGYFNVKAKRLKNFMALLFESYEGSLARMAKLDTHNLRTNLLRVNGIGPETADSILLYAFNKPVFVVDAYTKRIFHRHNLVSKDIEYAQLQDTFSSLPEDVEMFNEFHALLVKVGKDFCRPKARCEQCVLNTFHYSIKNKCQQCHRAFMKSERVQKFEEKYLCNQCVRK